ncbi:MAG: dehydrogenase [Pseudolabrys sp.]|nr:dehydrogenase [Pseudolabrys sp.]
MNAPNQASTNGSTQGIRDNIRTTCPRDCYDACGIVVARRDGRISKVLGDPNHPIARGTLCGKCALAYNGVWLNPAARLSNPLRRVGPKGSARFEAVEWDAALADIAARLSEIRLKDDSRKILHTHYTGTCSLIAGNFPARFFSHIGATEVDPDTVCNKAGHVSLSYVLGDSLQGFDPGTAKDASCLLVWGANPSAAAPHQHKHWLQETQATLISIDPIKHDTARRAALHLQLRPGSDAALAFAMMHVVLRDGLLDEKFVRDCVLGWQDIRSAVEQCTPEWGERQTGVAARLIVEAASTYARGPSLLWLGQGMQRQPKGGNAVRAVSALAAITGNFGKPGAGLLYMNGFGTRGIDVAILTRPDIASPNTTSVSHMDLSEMLADPGKSSALITWNNNILASSPRQAALRHAMAREDLFTVVVDCFQTDTADFADYVLPAASFLEFNDIVIPYFNNTVSAQVKASEPMGQSLPNQEVFRRLAKAMGLSEPALYESDEQIIGSVLGATGLGISFAQLAESGTVEMFKTPKIQFEGNKFPTPSGKIEIRSNKAAEHGHPMVPFPHADPAAAAGKVRVLSPAARWLMNSSYGNDPIIRKRLGNCEAAVNVDDAAAWGIASGTKIILRNSEGSLPVIVRVSDEVSRGVVLVPKGRWPKGENAGSNVNVLNPGNKTDIGESSSVHGVEAEVVIPG